MSQITGSDLFGKNGGDNLNRSVLKKAKKKGRLSELIERNIGYLVEYYFTTFRKSDERRKYEGPMLKLLGSDAYFIKPLGKMIKKAKKKKIKIPEGLNTLLMDSLDEVRFMYRKQVRAMEGGGKLSDDARSRINTIKTLAEILVNKTTEICTSCVKKRVKGLEKLGLMEEYAEIIARTYVPVRYLNPRNIRRYVYRLNLALYEVQRLGVMQLPDNEEMTNTVGVNLGNPEVIKEIYEYMLKGITKKTLVSAIVGIMLERRGSRFESFTKAQLACYNAITTLCMDVLEGNVTLMINPPKEKIKGKKAKKKAAKKAAFGKKELKAFMEMYSEERSKDIAKHQDSSRRISFATGIAEDAYPNILKAFRNANKEYFDSLFDSEGNKDKDQRQDRGKDDSRNRDQRDNRDNKDRRDNWKKKDRRDRGD